MLCLRKQTVRIEYIDGSDGACYFDVFGWKMDEKEVVINNSDGVYHIPVQNVAHVLEINPVAGMPVESAKILSEKLEKCDACNCESFVVAKWPHKHCCRIKNQTIVNINSCSKWENETKC